MHVTSPSQTFFWEIFERKPYPQKHMFPVSFTRNQFDKSKYFKSKKVEILLRADYK